MSAWPGGPWIGCTAVAAPLRSSHAKCIDVTGDVVGEEIGADQLGDILAAIHRAPHDAVADGVVVSEDRLGQFSDHAARRRRRRLAFRNELAEPFIDVPAGVAAVLDQVDLLPRVFADISSPEPACRTIEGHPPDIAQAEGPDFASWPATPTNGLFFGIA